MELIVTIPISGLVADTWVWHYDRHEKYSVRSGYKLHMMQKFVVGLGSDNEVVEDIVEPQNLGKNKSIHLEIVS